MPFLSNRTPSTLLIDEEIRNVFGAFYACDVDVALSIDDSEQADDAK